MATEMTKDGLSEAADALREGGPMQMVNLLRFHPQAQYEQGGDLPPCSGQEAYMQRYVPAFAHVAAQVAPGESFRPVFIGGAMSTLVAEPSDVWHAIAIMEYDSFDAFRRIVESDQYGAQAAPHRRAALADWRLVAVRKLDVPL